MPPRKRRASTSSTSTSGPPKHPRTSEKVDLKAEFKSLAGYPFDDIGNGKRLTAVFGGDIMFVRELRAWAVWDGDWKLDDQGAMNLAKRTVEKMQRESHDDSAIAEQKKAVHEKNPKSRAYIDADLESSGAGRYAKWASLSASVGKLHAMLETASSEPGIAVNFTDFDTDPAILNCPNGILELTDKVRIRPKDQRADRCLLSTGTPYDSSAVSVHWNQYLEHFFPEEDLRRWLQKVLGASLFGRNTDRMLVFAWGDTTSGKGMFMSAIEEALGSYAGPLPLSVLRDNQDERPRADLIQALPRRVVFADETSSEWKLHADQIKRVTGDGRISARAPHAAKSVEMVPSFVPWVMCNNPPEIRGRDKAIDRRVVVVPFNVSLPPDEDDPKYKVRMFADKFLGPAVLAWAVEGWKMYMAEGVLGTEPVDAMVARERLLSELSDVDVFVKDTCECGFDYQESSSDLYQAYERWAEINGTKSQDRLTQVQFGRMLTGRGYPKRTLWFSGKAQSGRTGLKLSKSWRIS